MLLAYMNYPAAKDNGVSCFIEDCMDERTMFFMVRFSMCWIWRDTSNACLCFWVVCGTIGCVVERKAY